VNGHVAADLDDGSQCDTDLVILAIGVKPETALAQSAGLALGARGGIAVDAQQRTSDPHIWAVGDATESRDVVLGQDVVLPLAGPANRQGRVAADAIAGRASRFRGVQATAICGVFGLQAACTGASEKSLTRASISDFAVVHLHPGSHASYYPGAKPVHLKLVYRPSDGRVLGAQAVGEDGIDKRIDVIATTIQLGGTVDDLAEAELCYAPQFGAAKDPVNIAGMIAQNIRAGDLPQASWNDPGSDLLDVREAAEIAKLQLPGAVHIPLGELRRRHHELPPGKLWRVVCAAGQRASFAVRFLNQHGHRAELLPGGMATRSAIIGG
jgi:rhodanese-related sulfurtransferase